MHTTLRMQYSRFVFRDLFAFLEDAAPEPSSTITTETLNSRLRPLITPNLLYHHRRRRFLQVYELGEDDCILAESLDDDVQYVCEEDVKKQRG